MNEKLQQAAQRLLAFGTIPIGKQKAHVREWPELAWDGLMLARAWHAEQPGPVTADWLRLVGFEVDGLYASMPYEFGAINVISCNADFDAMELWADDQTSRVLVKMNVTREQIRSLIFLIGKP